MGATLGTRLLTWLRGAPVGSDAYGNRYYRLKGDKPQRSLITLANWPHDVASDWGK